MSKQNFFGTRLLMKECFFQYMYYRSNVLNMTSSELQIGLSKNSLCLKAIFKRKESKKKYSTALYSLLSFSTLLRFVCLSNEN